MKIYSDRAYLSGDTSHATLLVPFWGPNSDDCDLIDLGRRYESYRVHETPIFDLTSLEDADIAVMPTDWEPGTPQVKQLERFAADVQHAGKPLVVFFWGDSFDRVPFHDAYVFRTSFHRSTRQPREYAVPVWPEDLLQEYAGGAVQVRPKTSKPTVGFCGFADPLNPTFADHMLRQMRLAKAIGTGKVGRKAAGTFGRRLRGRALQRLASSPVVSTNFIIRNRFFAGALASDGKLSPERFQQVRQEFVRNILDTDYTLCMRGAGNFSIRLYETLCCGRIPVFVDTDSPLPYDFAVNWREHVVWVEADDIDRIDTILADFHASLSPGEFEARQHASRQFWNEWLSPLGFFNNFHRHFAEHSSQV